MYRYLLQLHVLHPLESYAIPNGQYTAQASTGQFLPITALFAATVY